MLRSYLTVTLRRLRRQPGYAALNVTGLAVGVAACLVIALYVHHEWTYDRFHPDADRVVRVLVETEDGVSPSLPASLAAHLQADLPEVEAGTGFDGEPELLIEANGKTFYEDGGLRASAGFFDVFQGFEAVHGDPQAALREPGAVVLTRPVAETYFGDTNPVGETFTVRDEERIDAQAFREETRFAVETRPRAPYTVAAVVEAPPSNSTVDFRFVLSRPADVLDHWNMRGTTSYLRLRPGADREALGAKMLAVAAQHYEEADPEGRAMHAQPLPDVHLDPSLGRDARVGPAQYLAIFTLAALLILVIACVNYMNLATARAADRAREVGVRKSIGAGRGAIRRQFLGEALVFAALAVGVGLALAQAALPLFRRILGVELSLATLATPGALAGLVGGTLLVGLAAGSYPAFVLARFEPVRVLKGRVTPTGGTALLRRGLVVFQFAASVALVLATAIVHEQMDLVRAERLNVPAEEVLAVANRGKALDGGRYQALRDRLLADPAVARVTTGPMPGRVNLRLGTDLDTTGQFDQLGALVVGAEYPETLGAGDRGRAELHRGRHHALGHAGRGAD
jgi:putative ABC transport system permease protein